jgi:hypothetical protein
MKLEKWALIAEIVGGITIVVSLLFVGYEIQQNNRQQVRATTQELVGQYTSVLAMLVDNTEMRCTYAKGIADFNNLTGAEVVAFSSFLVALNRFREDLYFQYLDGGVEPDIFSGLMEAARVSLSYPGIRDWFEFRRNYFSRQYQAFVDELMKSPISVPPFDPTGCSV